MATRPDREPDIILPETEDSSREVGLYIRENLFYFPDSNICLSSVTRSNTKRYTNVLTYLEACVEDIERPRRANDAALALAQLVILETNY